MDATAINGIDNLLCTAYICAVACVNLNLYLISTFYQKKFNRRSPQTGFVLAITFMILYIASLLFVNITGGVLAGSLHFARSALLIGSAAISMWSALLLFIAMKKTGK
jgi:hypothetical protein